MILSYKNRLLKIENEKISLLKEAQKNNNPMTRFLEDVIWGPVKMDDPMNPPSKNDKVPAMLLPGESVISTRMFNKWAKKNSGKLRKLNNRVNGEK